MTEAGQKWAETIPNDNYTQRVDVVEEIIRAFCAEVRERAHPNENNLMDIGMAFKMSQRELLGD